MIATGARVRNGVASARTSAARSRGRLAYSMMHPCKPDSPTKTGSNDARCSRSGPKMKQDAYASRNRIRKTATVPRVRGLHPATCACCLSTPDTGVSNPKSGKPVESVDNESSHAPRPMCCSGWNWTTSATALTTRLNLTTFWPVYRTPNLRTPRTLSALAARNPRPATPASMSAPAESRSNHAAASWRSVSLANFACRIREPIAGLPTGLQWRRADLFVPKQFRLLFDVQLQPG
ncbi:hypothetical protein ABIA33_003640 [Streptacidiphilus sp. MAP12-16]